MSAMPPRPDPADLLAHAGGLEDLARRLVGAGAAADLVQETWLRAWMRPPRRDGPLGPWLRTVLRRLARDRRRGDAARRAREEDVARAPRREEGHATRGGDAHELVARAELHERLLRALLALPEAQRDVLLLRYFDGLTPGEIAERRGQPASTVRTQLERGLARLRERLEAGPGGPDAWRASVVAALGPLGVPRVDAAVQTAGVATSGGVAGTAPVLWVAGIAIMKTLGITALGVGVLGALVWTVTGGGEDGRRAVGGAESTAAVRSVEPSDVRDAADPRDDARRVVEGPADDASASAAAAAAPALAAVAADPSARLRARLVDRSGVPLAGGTLRLVESPAIGATADGGGEVELVAPLASQGPREATWEASAHGHGSVRARAVLEPGATVSLGTIELGPGGSLEGTVLSSDGRPATRASVIAVHPVREPGSPARFDSFGFRAEDRVFEVDAAGAFRIDGVPEGPIRVWAKDPDHDWTASDVLEVVAGTLVGPVVIELAGERHSLITGRVLDPDGAPVPNALVRYRVETADFSSVSSLRAGADGVFELHAKHAAPYDLTASDPDDRHGEAGLVGVEPGTTDLELRLTAARHVVLRVTDPAGRPIESFAAEAQSRSRSSIMLLLRLAEAPRPGGTLEFRLPAVPFDLIVSARGHERLEYGRIEPASAPAELAIVLRPVPGVSGTVRHAGEAVAGAEVSLWRAWPDSQAQIVDGLRVRVSAPELDTVTTDGDGRFRLDLRQGGRFVVRAVAEGFAGADVGPLELDGRQGAEGLELELARGGAIEGRVLTPPGVDAEGTVVAFNRGDGKAFSVRVGADGAYRAEGLLPGPWQVREIESDLLPYARSVSISEAHGPLEFDCTVTDGATTRFDLDLVDRVRADLTGELRLAAVALEGWVASLETGLTGPDVRSVAVATLDRDGRFVLRAPAGEYRLVLAGPVGGDSRLELSETVALSPDGSRWSRELATGRLEGRIDLERVEGVVRATLAPTGGALDVALRFTARADGGFGPLALPAGELDLRPAPRGSAAGAIGAMRIELPADTTRRVELP